MMGSLLTEGQHLYIDKKHSLWKQALVKLLDLAWEQQEQQEATALMLRDFREDDSEIREFFMDHGFIKIDIEENNIVNNSEKNNPIDFFSQKLDGKKKYYFRNEVLKDENLFTISIDTCKEEDIPIYYQLYKNVKSKKLSINTFDLPEKFFKSLCKADNWEVIKISLAENNKVLCVVFCEKNKTNYCPMIIGLDYSVDKSYNIYKKSLYQMIRRGLELQSDKICLGLSASEAKHKLGADTIKQVAYIQMKDNFSMVLIENIRMNVN